MLLTGEPLMLLTGEPLMLLTGEPLMVLEPLYCDPYTYVVAAADADNFRCSTSAHHFLP
jgi:hypothetical protein